MAGQLYPIDITYLASAARTTLQTQADQINPGFRGIKVFIDITVNAGSSAHLTVEVDVKDPASGKYKSLLTSASLSAVATTTLTIHPDIPASANVAAADILTLTYRIAVAVGDASPCTYSIGYSLIP